MYNSLWPHELQHARPPCLSSTPGLYPNSCPLSRWCHLTISFSVEPFSSCLQSSPASGSFLMGQLFTSSGQSIGASASASVLAINIQDWFPLGLTGWISLQSKELSKESSSTPQFKSINSLVFSFLCSPTLTFIHAAVAAAKSLQLWLTLCDPIDGSPPGSPIPGILQARTLEWVAIAFSIHTWLLEKPWLWLFDFCWKNNVSAS